MTDAPATPPPAAWHNGIDAGVIAAWQNKGYDLADPVKTATQMWEQYSHLQRHTGMPPERILYMPKDAADAAGIQQMRDKLGVPKEAKDYDFAGIKFGDGTELETGFTDNMRAALHKAGVAKDTAPEIVKAVIKYLDDADTADKTVATSKLAEQKNALKTSWGTKHDENLLAAKQAARRLGVDPETVAALEGVLGYDRVMEMFRKIGVGTNEDTFVAGRETGSPHTQQGAKARMDELQRDDGWVKRLMAGDITARREFDGLMQQIAGVAA